MRSTPASKQPIARVEHLLTQMTLKEKVGQMSQHPWGIGDPDDVRKRIQTGQIGSLLNAGDLTERNALQRLAVEDSRLGIPLIFGRDVIHGFRTIFPIVLGQSASFNPELVEQAAAIAAHEASEQGIDWTFAPMVDVGRDPRWGRVAETCGEDPFLTSQLGAAMVRGFQGNDITDGKHVAACAKHFAGYAASESGKDYNTTWIPERLLRDVHLPPFLACIEAGALTLMSAFNDLNGIPASANELILRTILQEEWGFNGFVVSDWAAVMELLEHGLSDSAREAARHTANAGLHMEMATTAFCEELPELVEQGSVSMATIDEAVRRILTVKHQLGLFDRPFKETPERTCVLSEPHRQVARELAQQSIVLLKNAADLLPLDPTIKTLALIGPLADDGKNQLGCWALDGKASESVTLREALTRRLRTTQVLFDSGMVDCRSNETSGFEEAVRKVARADVAVVCVGEDANMSGEAKSRAFLNLPGAQLALLERLHRTGTPLVVVFMAGRPLVIDEPCKYARAALYAWHLGTQAGEALSDVIFGEVSPSGKLPMSLPRAEGQIPVYYGRRNTGRPPKTERQGVPSGTPLDPVDFASNYIDVEVTPLFPFGYGLAYTRFEYFDLKVTPQSTKLGSAVQVSVDVSNVGTRAGTEVVQLYVRDLVGCVTRPLRELKGFKRVLLEPGEHKTLVFSLGPGELAFTGRDMRSIVEPGRFQVFVGTNSNAELTGEFELT